MSNILCRSCDLYVIEVDDLKKQLTAARAEIERLRERYTWCANELLACDYGDNDHGKMGWIVYGWRSRNGERRIYGDSIDAAIDAAKGRT